MTVKKIPMRTCIACKVEKPKKELIRIVKTKEGKFFLDKTGKASGRGAYCCNHESCMNKIIQKRLLNKSFECEIPPEVYTALGEDFFADK